MIKNIEYMTRTNMWRSSGASFYKSFQNFL